MMRRIAITIAVAGLLTSTAAVAGDPGAVEGSAVLYFDWDRNTWVDPTSKRETTDTATSIEFSPKLTYLILSHMGAGIGGLLSSTSVMATGAKNKSSELGVFAHGGYYHDFSESFHGDASVLVGYSKRSMNAETSYAMNEGHLSRNAATNNLLVGVDARVAADITPWLFAFASARYLYRHGFSTDGTLVADDTKSTSHRVMFGAGVGVRFTAWPFGFKSGKATDAEPAIEPRPVGPSATPAESEPQKPVPSPARPNPDSSDQDQNKESWDT